MSDLEDIYKDTPEDWVPFETILCDCDKLRTSSWATRWMFIGLGPFHRPDQIVQLVVRVDDNSHQASWSIGPYLKERFHLFDPETCNIGRA